MAFIEHERARALKDAAPGDAKKLSSETIYLQIAALRAFYAFAETGKAPAAKHRRKPLLSPAVEAPAAVALRCRNHPAAQTRNRGRASRLVRSGGARTGLRLRLALGGIARHPPGTTSSGGRLRHRYWQGQQGARRARGPPGGRQRSSDTWRRAARNWSRPDRRAIYF